MTEWDVLGSGSEVDDEVYGYTRVSTGNIHGYRWVTPRIFFQLDLPPSGSLWSDGYTQGAEEITMSRGRIRLCLHPGTHTAPKGVPLSKQNCKFPPHPPLGQIPPREKAPLAMEVGVGSMTVSSQGEAMDP